MLTKAVLTIRENETRHTHLFTARERKIERERDIWRVTDKIQRESRV